MRAFTNRSSPSVNWRQDGGFSHAVWAADELSYNLTNRQDQDAARVDEPGQRLGHLQNAALRPHLETGSECGGRGRRAKLEQWVRWKDTSID